MNVIIVVGSKHGSTRSIAEAVGDELRNSWAKNIAAELTAPISRIRARPREGARGHGG